MWLTVLAEDLEEEKEQKKAEEQPETHMAESGTLELTIF